MKAGHLSREHGVGWGWGWGGGLVIGQLDLSVFGVRER